MKEKKEDKKGTLRNSRKEKGCLPWREGKMGDDKRKEEDESEDKEERRGQEEKEDYMEEYSR